MTARRPPRVGLRAGAVAALAAAPRVGPLGIRELIDRVGDPLEALAAAPRALELNAEGRAALARRLAGRSAEDVARATASAAGDALSSDDRLLAYGVPGYPPRLTRLHFPPPLLWARGPLPADAPRTVAVVGTRRASRPARELAHELAADLAARGVRIVSGLAAGIDGAAHRGALTVRGETVGVLGSGLQHRYPRANHDLYDRLRGEGLLLTEFAPEVRPKRHHFPRRNRIVAALCDAVIVVQAGVHSGALLTAGEAEDIGIEVMAVPGDPRLAASRGCHELIRDGVLLVTRAADVLDGLGWETGGAEGIRYPAGRGGDASGGERAAIGPEGVGPASALLARLEDAPAPLDELASLAGGVRPAAALLARLELAGEVVGRPGGHWERVRGAG